MGSVGIRKIRKTTLVISIVVVMASLLIACGDTTNQVPTTSGDTTNQTSTPSISASIKAITSIIAEQRQESYGAAQQIYNLEQNNSFQGCSTDYYVNARTYYTNSVQFNFNSWLESFASEVQNGQPLNTSNDQSLISNAFKANYAFTTWTDQLDKYFTSYRCSQAQGSYHAGYLTATSPKGIPIEWPEEKPVIPERVIDGLKKVSDDAGFVLQSMPTPIPTQSGTSAFPTQSVEDTLGQAQVIRAYTWQNFCGVVQASSC